jgi:hypothetical protein
VPMRAQARQNGVRLRKWNSTLTQMDFLATSAFHHDQTDELTPLQLDSDIKDVEGGLTQLDGSGDAPNPRQPRDTRFMGNPTFKRKRKRTSVVSQESQEFRPIQKKEKADGEVAADVLEHGRRTSSRVASVKATRSIGLLSARHGEDYDDNVESFESPSIRSNAAASRQNNPPARLQEPYWPTSGQENQPLSQHKIPGASFPRTPLKRKDFVPSSLSPESLPPSTGRTKGPGAGSCVLSQERSPLKECSVNRQLNRRKKDRKETSSNRMQGPSPPKRKICILKPPRHSLQQERALFENAQAISKYSIWSPLSSSPRLEESKKAPFMPALEIKDSAGDLEPIQPAEQPLQAPTLEVKNGVEGDEPEITGMSEVDSQPAPVSSPGTVETQETLPSLRRLLGLRDAPAEAIMLQTTDKQNQSGHSNVVARDFAMGDYQCRASQSPKAGLEQDEPSSVEASGAASVADSEDEEGSVLALSPGSSIANDTQFNAELAERIPTLSADASPSPSATPKQRRSFSPSLQLAREIELSLPRRNLVHQPSAYSTTKTVPLNDTSSSPCLPSRSTQRTVYPASIPRPSQVSTQDPTQPYLPMSSMPLAPFSSPTRSGPATITIKDSSSVPRPLRDIPSQRHSQSQPQSQLNIDLGLNDCLDAEDNEELDEELVAMSDKLEWAIDEQQESQTMPLPLQTFHTRDEGEARSKTTERGSPVRRRRPRKPVIPLEVRALLGESFFESVPGPPGWSQRSWDDEPL